jgi:hypothetical protein
MLHQEKIWQPCWSFETFFSLVVTSELKSQTFNCFFSFRLRDILQVPCLLTWQLHDSESWFAFKNTRGCSNQLCSTVYYVICCRTLLVLAEFQGFFQIKLSLNSWVGILRWKTCSCHVVCRKWRWNQCDQIGLIFAHWVIIYRSSQHLYVCTFFKVI